VCGIAGLYRLDDRIDLGRLGHMARLLRHRGPDDEGIVLLEPGSRRAWTLGGPDTPPEAYRSPHPYAPGRRHGGGEVDFRVGLAFRRLAIVDLSPGGHQPMCDADARHWLVFNGEIYNYVELRAELAAMGERFTSASDTEVILAAYRRWKHDAFARMNGMFAIALWDSEAGELVCARDRLGVKPFYYQWDGRTFAFASEPKALVLTQAQRIAPRLEAIRDLVALDWVDHESATFFEGLWQLPPGHLLGVSERGFWMRRWWSLDPRRRAQGGGPDSWSTEFAELFTDAVRIRMRADVEVGSCLSGGLDSSAVVTTAARFADKPLHAFTCAYDEGPAFDERNYVRATVAASGAVSHVIVPDGADFWSVLDRMTFQQDEPTAGPGVYSQWKVMSLAHRAGLRVLLDGQGGDETLAGYERYLPLRLRDLLASGDLVGFANGFQDVARRLGPAHALALVIEPWVPRALFAPLRQRFGQGKDRVLAPALRRLPGRPPAPPAGFRSAVARQQAFDLLQRLLPSLLRYEDRNSMAFSIETRLPFLDYRVVELAFALPDAAKLDGRTSKAVLRRALADRIPAEILARRDKMGFETPADIWLRSRYRGELSRRLRTPGPIHDWIDPKAADAVLDQYLAGRPIGLQIWRWLALESWARQYLAADPRVMERRPRIEARPGLPATDGRMMGEATRELQAQGVTG
jgi:asparagine synthase (glutamine-hydrolysing)